MSDYDFDMIEKEYERLATDLNIGDDVRIDKVVGWKDTAVMNLNSFYKIENNTLIRL